MAQKTRLIGITGGIGSGKSVVSRICRLKGFGVYDCDMRAREIMSLSDNIKEYIRNNCGDNCIGVDGAIIRPILASKVFSDTSFRMGLNEKVHSAVRSDLSSWLEKINNPIAFVESAILVTSGLDKMVDSIWHVTAKESERIARVIKRNGMSEDQVKERMRAQECEYDSLKGRSDVITILNDDDSELLSSIDNYIRNELEIK
jgi:dephospho-CoA kinase